MFVPTKGVALRVSVFVPLKIRHHKAILKVFSCASGRLRCIGLTFGIRPFARTLLTNTDGELPKAG